MTGVLGLVVTAIAGGAGLVLASRSSRTRTRHWRAFTAVFVIILSLCLLGVNQFPYDTARPGADYDIIMRNSFLQTLGYSASPGVAALLAALVAMMTPRAATGREGGPGGSRGGRD